MQPEHDLTPLPKVSTVDNDTRVHTTSSVMPHLKRAMSFTRPNSTSVDSVRSWASSIIITLQAATVAGQEL
jgi:hypothetical protein